MAFYHLDPRQAGTGAAPNCDITEAVGGGVIVLINGFQWGGDIDASGAGNAVFPDEQSALRAAREAAGFGHVAETACDAFVEPGHLSCAEKPEYGCCADAYSSAAECADCAWPRDAHRVQS